MAGNGTSKEQNEMSKKILSSILMLEGSFKLEPFLLKKGVLLVTSQYMLMDGWLVVFFTWLSHGQNKQIKPNQKNLQPKRWTLIQGIKERQP